MRRAANFVGFQLVWLACVLWRDWGLAVFATVLALHLALVPDRARELRLLVAAGAAGWAAELAMRASGATSFASGAVPAWMVALWVNFASTLNWSLDWLRGRFALAALLGAVAGPLSYWGGERLGALSVPRPLVVGLVWAVATPALVWLAARGRA
jgi:hypothetical protein